MFGGRAQTSCVAWSPCWGLHRGARVSRGPAWLNQSCAAGTASAWRGGSRCPWRRQVGRFMRVGARVGPWQPGLWLRGPCAPFPCLHLLLCTTAHITGRSTRTHTCRRRLRRNGGGPVTSNVIWHWRRMSRVGATLARLVSCHLVTLLGAARSRSGEPRASMVESKLCRRHGCGAGHWLSEPFAPAGKVLRAHRRAGGSLAIRLAAAGAMRAFPGPASFAVHHGSYNWSANTEQQLQEAASPQRLLPGCLQRYMASFSSRT